MILPGEYDVTREWIVDEWPHVCSILRRQQVGETPLEEPIWDDRAVAIEDLSCFFWFQTGGERNAPNRVVIEYEWRMLVPLDADIRHADIVDNVYAIHPITREYIRRLNDGAVAVRSIGKRNTNQLIILREVRSQ